MKQTLIATLLIATAAPALAAPAHDPVAMGKAALSDTVALDIVDGLTTEIGPRLAATPDEARAREWAARRLKAMKFANVRIEPFMMEGWVRGAETAETIAPFPQKLKIAALGHSGATLPQGISAEIAYFPTFADLEAAPAGSVAGKIAFISHAMKAAQDGSGYGPFGRARREGPALAASKGAIAVVIRSIGTDSNRDPHTGITNWNGATPIPAGALSIPDAENLERMLVRGKPVTVRLTLTPRFTGQQQSGNVVAEVPGTDPKAGAVLIGCHLDSWDLATGAIDDASGCAIITAAAKRIMDAGKPRRTIRILWAGAEEVGAFGGEDYAKTHADIRHAVALESDFGADRVWRAVTKLPEGAKATAAALSAALAPLGIPARPGEADGGADVEPTIKAQKLAVVDLSQDGTRYFDLHHTPDDTFDKIDPAQIAQNVAAWTATLAVLANAGDELDAPLP